MELKICKKCLLEKNYLEFDISRSRKDGRWHICKDCRSTSSDFRNKRKEKLSLFEQNKRRCYLCKEIKDINFFVRSKKGLGGHSDLCKECNKVKAKKAQEKESYKIWRANYEKTIDWTKYYPQMAEYRKKNSKIRSKKEYQRRKSNPIKRFSLSMLTYIRDILKDNNIPRAAHSKELLGCSAEFLYDYIESKFTEGMTWDNWAKDGWHVDHIKPMASFDLTDPIQQLMCFHYTNLQPLWAKDNLSKGSLYEGKRHIYKNK